MKFSHAHNLTLKNVFLHLQRKNNQKMLQPLYFRLFYALHIKKLWYKNAR